MQEASDNDELEMRTRISDIQQLGRDLLYSETRAIDELIHDLSSIEGQDSRPEFYVPVFMMQAVGVSLHSVLALTREREMGIRDCFGVARSAVETAVNAAFISVSGEEMAEKAVRHMRQKRWRDLHRTGRVGNLNITVSRNVDVRIDDMPGLREALAEYTNKKGEEIRDWTPESLEKRIATITSRHNRAGLCLGGATFSIYRPASELLHGTFYGVNLFWQGSLDRPAKDRAEFDKLWMLDHFTTLMSAMVLATAGAVFAISDVHNIHHHSHKQDKLLDGLSALAAKMSKIDADDNHVFHTDLA